MRSKHGSSHCHELSCAVALVMAVAATASAATASNSAPAPHDVPTLAFGVRPATPTYKPRSRLVGRSRGNGSGNSNSRGRSSTGAKERVQALSMTLATAPRVSAGTTATTTIAPVADSIRRRRRRRPFGDAIPNASSGATATSIVIADAGGGRGRGSRTGGVGFGARVDGIRKLEGIGATSAGEKGFTRRREGAGAAGTGRGDALMAGWHPAAEPDAEDDEDAQYENWRRMRVEELVKDQFLTPGRVNEIMDPNNLQRHQYNTNPDSSFGAVFQLDTLVDVIPGLIHPAWVEVARALNQDAPTLNTVQRGYGWTPEQMFVREFNWRLSQEELEGGIEIYERTILRKALKYEPSAIGGSRRWLETLRRIPMPMAVLSRLPSAVVDSVLKKTDLAGYFPHRVTGEDEKFDDYRGYMLAAIKVKRSTMKCCAFDCRQEGMIKAHDADLRGVCRIGVMAAWELRLADFSVESFDDMTVLDFRQIFADREFEPGMLQMELQPEAAPQRQVEVATKVATQWADEEPETEVDSGGGDGRGDGRRGLRRQY